MKVRHDCAPEYLTFDCGVDYMDSWKLPQKSKGRGDALRKALACMEESSIVLFPVLVAKKKIILKWKFCEPILVIFNTMIQKKI